MNGNDLGSRKSVAEIRVSSCPLSPFAPLRMGQRYQTKRMEPSTANQTGVSERTSPRENGHGFRSDTWGYHFSFSRRWWSLSA